MSVDSSAAPAALTKSPVVGHDPNEYSALLAKKLGSRQRHIVFLFGAGVSKSAGLPDVSGLKTALLAREKERKQTAIATLLATKSVEESLTWLRKAESLLADGESVGGFTKDEINALNLLICKEIMQIISSSTSDPLAFERLGRWLGTTEYTRPVELFTLNYDLLVERGLEEMRVPYFDGFIGTYEGQFRDDLVDAVEHGDFEQMPSFMHRVWKLHGSISWKRTDENVVLRLGRVAEAAEMVAIHPADSKYDDSRRAPFVILHDRFRRSLLEAETLCLVSGYSFGDQHVNEVLFDAVRTRPRSEFVILIFGDISDELAQFASTWRNFHVLNATEAILGGVRGPWTEPESGAESALIWNKSQGFLLSDFAHLASFLAGNSAVVGASE